MSRPFTVVDVAQGTPEWLRARCGKLTGTGAADMLAKIKTGEAAGRRNLRTKLVVERLTGVPQEEYVNADMRRGTELEPDGFVAYEAVTGTLVTRYGFLEHVDLPVGFSPDGIIGDFEGLLELKCPKAATHMGYWRGQTIPPEYRPQLLHGLWVTGAAWVDFCSFDPRFPERLQLFRVRLVRTPETEIEIAAYRECALKFLDEVQHEYDEALRFGVTAA